MMEKVSTDVVELLTTANISMIRENRGNHRRNQMKVKLV